jgi:hypothetical protein
MEQIIVIIGKDGTATIEAVGFTGSSCEAATRPLEAALGVVADRTLKPEYFETEAAQGLAVEGGGE